MRRLWIPPVLALALLSGCATNLPAPRGPSAGLALAEAAWARVLARHVDERDRIDFAGIAAAPEDLDSYVSYVGAVSPKQPDAFPTREAKRAYFLNAYNALAMYGVIQSGIPESLGSIKFRFFYRNRFVMGAERISLFKLEGRGDAWLRATVASAPRRASVGPARIRPRVSSRRLCAGTA